MEEDGIGDICEEVSLRQKLKELEMDTDVDKFV